MQKVILIFLLGLILFWGNCTKNPTGPTSAQGPFLYALSEQYGDGYCRIFYIDTSVDSLVDSLLLPYEQLLGLGVSPNGRIVYLFAKTSVSGPWVSLEIDLPNKAILSQGKDIGVPTPDGRYLIDVFSTGLRVIDAKTHRRVYQSDTAFAGIPVTFDEKRGLVYGRANTGSGMIGVFNYKRLKWERIIDLVNAGASFLTVLDFVVAPYVQKLYYTGPTRSPFFCVLDLIKDTVLQQIPINSGGHLSITNDNRYVYITDPGGYLFEPVTTGYIGVYSTLDEAPAPSLDTRMVDDSSCENFLGGGLPTDQIAITPDGRKIYASVFFDCLMVVIDLPSNRLRAIDLGGTTLIRQLLIQP